MNLRYRTTVQEWKTAEIYSEETSDWKVNIKTESRGANCLCVCVCVFECITRSQVFCDEQTRIYKKTSGRQSWWANKVQFLRVNTPVFKNWYVSALPVKSNNNKKGYYCSKGETWELSWPCILIMLVYIILRENGVQKRSHRKQRPYTGESWWFPPFHHLCSTNDRGGDQIRGCKLQNTVHLSCLARIAGAKLISPLLQPNFQLNAGAIVCFQGRPWIAVMTGVILGSSDSSFLLGFFRCVLPFMRSDCLHPR